MHIISHRGNLQGKDLSLENNPSYIKKAIHAGFDVEIDVWFVDRQFFLGHDRPEYEIDKEFLTDNRLWCHAKNYEAFKEMWLIGSVHFFWHETDKITMTSKGIPWLFPKNYSEFGVTVHLDEPSENVSYHTWGICTDNPLCWKYKYK